MAPPTRTSNCSLLLIYRPRKDKRLSWPSWLTCSGRCTHISQSQQNAYVPGFIEHITKHFCLFFPATVYYHHYYNYYKNSRQSVRECIVVGGRLDHHAGAVLNIREEPAWQWCGRN